ncbi:sensor histidine kinase [Phycicoccus sp. BSK3Z-2]|uniref:Oxygen sensor histidine kinase NreB n=1 Tax=Phycicoccus avicenniae TaxID=2828860 RepID=A0A941DBI7_9MICO|nr:sensor histidine kinase [Phycicoccus avicenniae]MBR7744648.1 sensor histidine kinase [Phycicoccus avicenniae]
MSATATETDGCERPEGSSSGALDAWWHRQLPWWHGLFVVVLGAALVVAVLDDPGPHGRWVSPVLLLVIGGAYAGLGVRGLRDDRRAGLAYQVLAWTLLVAVQWLDPGTEAWMLYFVLYPQMWAMLSARQAVAGTVLTLTAFGVTRYVQSGYDDGTFGPIVVSSVISLGVSLALGLFIHRIVGEADARATTIDELRATQARLAAVERDRGVQDERERISREIHDTLAQGFTSVVTLSRAADAALARGDVDTARERLALVERTATDNLAEARLIVAELTPGHLQSRSLAEALVRLGDAVGRETGLRTEVRVDGEPAPLGGAAEVVVLRTAQEALANVRRHAGAGHVAVALSYRPERVVLSVADDGCGFDADTDHRGFGLDGVRARAAQVGGRVDLLSGPGAGTTLTLEVPR